MKSSMILLFLLFVIAGCSFSKNVKSNQTVVEKQGVGKIVQENILAAVRSNNLTLLKQYLSDSNLTDLDFSENESPFSIALESNSVEVMKVLVNSNLNVFKLGASRDPFYKYVSEYEFRKSLALLNKELSSPSVDTAKSVLAEAQRKVENKIFEQFKKDGSKVALRIAKDLDVDFEFLELTAIVDIQRGNTELTPFLVENEIMVSRPSVIQVLYEFELLRLIVDPPVDRAILSYLNEHRFLIDKMWNVSGSGLYISVNGLFVLLEEIYKYPDLDKRYLPSVEDPPVYVKGDFVQEKGDKLVSAVEPDIKKLAQQLYNVVFKSKWFFDSKTYSIRADGGSFLGNLDIEVPRTPFEDPEKARKNDNDLPQVE